MEDNFRDISIRGRLAFGMTCLEEVLRKYNINDELLDTIVLPKIWEFTSSSHLDEWEMKINEIDPTCVLDIELTEQNFDLTTISYNTYRDLLNLYKTLPTEIVELIAEIIRIGVANIYGGTESYSPATLEPLANVLIICKRLNVDLPKIDQFKKSTFSQFHGWGDERPREYFTDN